jgi:predicted dehydrogenase
MTDAVLQDASRPREDLPGRLLGVGVIGCGLIGGRRARAAAEHPRTRLVAVADVDEGAARAAAGESCDVATDWRAVLSRPDVDIVVVATPNGLLEDVVTAALRGGRHVLMEKPMGRNLEEARRMAAVAAESGRVLGVGFNHRHHPAVRRALELVRAGAIGRVVSIRGRYGHGGRPGLESEWRADPAQAGGGELLDQGIHLLDLFNCIAGAPHDVFGAVQTAVWAVHPLEDNAYALLRFGNGAVGQLHASMTQWKNLFSLEVHGEAGAVVVDGLGGSYGVERLVHVRRAFQGGAPEMREELFDGPDLSWADEWGAFIAAVDGVPSGVAVAGPEDGVLAMQVVDAIYRSAALRTVAVL